MAVCQQEKLAAASEGEGDGEGEGEGEGDADAEGAGEGEGSRGRRRGREHATRRVCRESQCEYRLRLKGEQGAATEAQLLARVSKARGAVTGVTKARNTFTA